MQRYVLTNRFLILISTTLLGVIGLQGSCFAQASQAIDRPPIISDEGGAIPVRVVDGRLIVACDISGPRLRAPMNLWLDFDGAYGLQLHNRAAAPLPAETNSGKPLPLTLHFPDFTMEVARRELGPEEEFEEFTKYHSKEIGENALSGAIGAQILKHFDVVFDLPRNQVLLSPPGSLAGYQADPANGEQLVPITLQNDLVWLPVELDKDDEKLERALAIGSSRYDTVIDKRLCNSLRRPAGNIGSLVCQSIDFAPFVAFRPEEVIQTHPEGVAGVMGLNLLEKFRVHVDRQSLLATLLPAGSPSFPDQDLAWFQAMVSEDRDIVLDWLEKYSETRLGREAAEFLLTLLLDEGADEDELSEAVQWVNDTMPKDLRATRMFDLLEELVNEGETPLGIAAGELGIKSARQDRYPESNYKLHGRLGELMLQSDRREAWRHLLSAAFGLPEDGMINLNLARVYEADGKRKRAFSRYIQALVKEESSELAMEALKRLDQDLPPEERMTIETIDRMISGRVRNYSAPTKYELDPLRGNHTCLVEFFTNAYVGNEQRGGAIGGAMGNQGVISHFEPAECVFLSYHLAVPKVEPLANPLGQLMAEWLGVPGPMVQVIDGKQQAPGMGKHRDAEKIYKAARNAVVPRLRRNSPIAIECDLELDDTSLSGLVRLNGPKLGSSEDLALPPITIQIVVAERGVVFHGSSGVVIHRMLARGLATPGPLSGVPYLPDENGQLTIDIDRNLADLQRENTEYLDSLEEGQTQGGTRMGLRIDPASVEVIVVVRNAETAEVIQSIQAKLPRQGVSQ